MSLENTTQQELAQGYKECDCRGGIELLQAGFEVPLYHCKKCDKMMASREEFFNVPVEVSSK